MSSFFIVISVDVDLQRDSLVELEERPAVQGGERLTRELELHGQDRAFLLLVLLESRLSVAGDLHDLRAREDAGVVTGGVLRFAGEPETRRDFLADLHDGLLHSGVLPLVESPDRESTAVEK
jgi:hypothetical protein